MLQEEADIRSVDLYDHQNHFLIVVECKQSALINKTGQKKLKTADNDKPEVAPRDGAMKMQIYAP